MRARTRVLHTLLKQGMHALVHARYARAYASRLLVGEKRTLTLRAVHSVCHVVALLAAEGCQAPATYATAELNTGILHSEKANRFLVNRRPQIPERIRGRCHTRAHKSSMSSHDFLV